MWNNEEGKKRDKLSHEILAIFGVSSAVSIFFFGFLRFTSKAVVLSYCEKNQMDLQQMFGWAFESWIQSVSLASAIFLFIVLFLFLLGQKIGYLKEIILGIEALCTHSEDYEIPLEGNNEFTELAERINYFSKSERELMLREKQMQEKKESLIRALSHDIRTPLTSIVSYSEYMKGKDDIKKQEIEDYISLMQQKAEQIKVLTDRLLEGRSRSLEQIDSGKFLMMQLADEWEAALENKFNYQVNLEKCPEFSGEFDTQELRRIFDNLASNIEKYADMEKIVYLGIFEQENRLQIIQENQRKAKPSKVESHKIGIESIRKIAQSYGGDVEVILTEQEFSIRITLMEVHHL